MSKRTPDAVLSAMETETSPLPDAVASAWESEMMQPDAPTAYAIEVRGRNGAWIKFRIGSRRGKQAVFDTIDEANAFLASTGFRSECYRIVEIDA